MNLCESIEPHLALLTSTPPPSGNEIIESLRAIDEFLVEHRDSLDKHLVHMLENRSYIKALAAIRSV